MDKEKISHFQMGVLFFVFMTGSSIINIPGPLISRAGNGAYISLLISGAMGFWILGMLLYLHKRFPDLNYVEYSRKLIGNVPTIILSLMSISFILQMQSAIVLDVGLFMISSMLRETPLYAFTLLVFLISGLTVRAGLEVMARMFTLIMLLTVFFVGGTLLLAIPDFRSEMLLPLLPKGIKPVIHGAYFTFGFPYVEVFLFGMLLPYVVKSQRKQVPRSMLTALGVNLFTLILVTFCSIMVFGAYASERPYLLYSMAQLVEFQEIIQRIESVIGISLILGSYMKTTITLYVLNMFVVSIWRLKDSKRLVMPLALLGFLMGLVTFDSSSQWGIVVTSVHALWAGVVFFVPLVIVTAVASIRRKA